jgi:protein-S-isoprenylcysteine O-methyltransferase Ste14
MAFESVADYQIDTEGARKFTKRHAIPGAAAVVFLVLSFIFLSFGSPFIVNVEIWPVLLVIGLAMVVVHGVMYFAPFRCLTCKRPMVRLIDKAVDPIIDGYHMVFVCHQCRIRFSIRIVSAA